MYISNQKEQFSIAFVRAVAAVAGCDVSRVEVDQDSIDLTISGRKSQGTTHRCPRLDIQLKCTETDDGKGAELVYELPMKNYDDLRLVEVHVPHILVVVCVPGELTQWLHESPEQTAMRRVAYWRSLRGEPAVPNKRTHAVHLPRSQRFTVAELRAVMARISEGGQP